MIASLRNAAAQVRAGVRLGSALRRPLHAVEGYGDEIRSRLATREQLFLDSLERVVFAVPHSPYRRLCEVAGYDFARVRQLVLTRGLDGALDHLRTAGVYLNIQEFKGSAPAVRNGRTLQFRQEDFATPAAAAVVRTRSSGSRSTGTVGHISMQDFLAQVRLRRWLFEGYDLARREMVLLMTPLTGLAVLLRSAAMGQPPVRWYSPVPTPGVIRPLVAKVAQVAGGVRLPAMEVVPPERILEVVRFIAGRRPPHGVVVVGFVNAALRLVLAAAEAGVSLGDVTFFAGGEPITERKRHAIEGRGYGIVPHYALAELGFAASACTMPRHSDDMHVLSDRLAVRQYLRPVAGGGRVEAYLMTTLLPDVRFFMVNTETGDYGGLETRACGCFLGRAGLTLHIHHVRSFEKLTAEGVTFFGPALIDLLEEDLPRAFGGDARHYQLVEAEDNRGLTRLYLLASPALGPLDENDLREFLLRELARRHLYEGSGRVASTVWRGAGTVRVVRRDPLATASGKVLHLHRSGGARRAEFAVSEEGA